MPSIGVNVAVLKFNKILLTRREDFNIWCLPGGAVDAGESVAQAALREVREEVGLKVELERLVGIYSEPNWFPDGLHIVLFAARSLDTELHLDPGEVAEAAFFGLDELPEPLIFGHRQRSVDALKGTGGGVVWRQDRNWPFSNQLNRSQLYNLRDQSGLSRREFYLRYLQKCEPNTETLEVGKSLQAGEAG